MPENQLSTKLCVEGNEKEEESHSRYFSFQQGIISTKKDQSSNFFFACDNFVVILVKSNKKAFRSYGFKLGTFFPR